MAYKNSPHMDSSVTSGLSRNPNSPFGSRFDGLLNAIDSQYRETFNGQLGEAIAIGNALTLATRALLGLYDVNDVSYTVTTHREPEEK